MSVRINTTVNSLDKLRQYAINNAKAIPGAQRLQVTGAYEALTVPAGANYAICILESDETGVAARCLSNGEAPVATSLGLPLYDRSTFDISDYQNLVNFKIIEEVAASATYLNIEYYMVNM
jgi:hypothetical protein